MEFHTIEDSLIVGLLDKNTELYHLLENLRNESEFTQKYYTLDKNGNFCSSNSNDENTKIIPTLKSMLDKIVHVNNGDIEIETTNLKAPCLHKFSERHKDYDEYGEGRTFLFYLNVDSSIENGNLRLYINRSEEEYKIANREIVKSKYDNEEHYYEVNPRTYDDKIVFVSFDGSIDHSVEYINGTGTREAVFIYIME